ncbi:MAG: disulfide oxidoreductase [Neomegalonema sp.]|nr:disulfide oxidoreductase [Neomegalonema sp.]
MRDVDRGQSITALLGPTNTGKTHTAIERMLQHRSGVIGFPLRLLAREVYDKIVRLRGPKEVALITGEEKIVPPDARYCVATVESMPLDWGAEFVAVDEIQLCGDLERGHVFTNRLLQARGKVRTMFLGSMAMREKIAALWPSAQFETRQRLSELSYSGSKKLSRLPARTAIVAFSAENVYALAELLRRQKGGAAVVMGALSPRTRNAQVALYQEGDVDYLVATDAIGMGLNLDVRHVAFAGRRKFDGRRHRDLTPSELAQIAGRAGRHVNDGTFGVTGEAPPFDEEVIEAIERHRFESVRRLQWRNADLAFVSPLALIRSLEADPPSEHLAKARESSDLAALRLLAKDPDVAAKAQGRTAVQLLWQACQIPDFRKTSPTEHASLVGRIFGFLISDEGVLPEDWLAAQVARIDRTEGDIDTLSTRLAYIRTWTYIANRSRWVADPEYWRERTRAIEDNLSDALHARLTQRFVDRRTSVLARRLKQKEKLVATVDEKGEVTVEGEFVGRLEGFRFQPDPNAAGAEVKTLQAASAQALTDELTRRVESFYKAPDAEIDVTQQGGMMWGSAAVGKVETRAGETDDPLAVRAVAFVDDMLDAALKEKVERRLQFWIDSKIKAAFEPLFALRDDEALTGMARGVAFQLIERLGVAPRPEIADDVKALEQEARGLLRKHGVRFGQHTVFLPALLKPAPTRMRILLWGLAKALPEIPSPPPPGHVTIPADPQAEDGYYTMAGYRACGPRAVRLDMLERLADIIRNCDVRGGFEAAPEMLSITGSTLDQFAEIMAGLGYQSEKLERPKRPKKKPTPKAAEAAEEPQPPAGLAAAILASATAQAAAESASDEAVQEGAPEASATAETAPAPAASETPAETDGAGAKPAAEAAPATDAPAAAETSDAPAAEASDAAPADAEAAAEPESSAELETYFVFRLAPRGRRPRAQGDGEGRRGGPRRGQRREGEAQGQEAGGGRRRRSGEQDGDGRRQEGGPGRGGSERKEAKGEGGGRRDDRKRDDRKKGDRKKGGQQGGKQREFASKPPARAADPDSPFAVLARLKEQQ